MRSDWQYPFERRREYLFDSLYGGAGVSGCCSPNRGDGGGRTMEMSRLHRALLVTDLVQMGQPHKSALLEVSRTMPWRQLHNWAIEPAQLGLRSGHQLVLRTKEAKVPTNIIAKGAHKATQRQCQVGGTSLPLEPLGREGWHTVLESGVNGCHFPYPVHIHTGARGVLGLTEGSDIQEYSHSQNS